MLKKKVEVTASDRTFLRYGSEGFFEIMDVIFHTNTNRCVHSDTKEKQTENESMDYRSEIA